jgi:transposase InsO family protein
LDAATIERVVHMTLHDKPPAGTHWSARKLARAVSLNHASVQRIWAAHGLKPHLTRTFKLSNDPRFCDKVQDIVGLYLDPPDKALVLCVDEKSQIQALDRTQPGLPMKKGRAGTMTHDYKRHGTTTLFAALDVATGKVIGECMPRHRHQEFLRFLRTIDRNVSEGLDLHLVVDNYATHKHAKVKAWLKRHTRLGEFESEHPGYRGAQDTFYVGNLKGVGRVYQQTFIDTYAKAACAKLYDRKTPTTAAGLLNDRVIPFYESQDVKLLRILTVAAASTVAIRSGTNTSSISRSKDIDHSRTKTKSPQTNGVCERFHKIVLNEFYRIAFRKKLYRSIDELQADLDMWIREYNEAQPHQGRWCFGKTPMHTFLDALPMTGEKMIAA